MSNKEKDRKEETEMNEQQSEGAGVVEPVAESEPVNVIADENEFQLRLNEEMAAHREALLRMQAETENLRKRMQRDLDRSRKFALEGIMKDLLQVQDGLQRGLDLDGEALTVEALREGQQLTHKMLAKVMSDHKLEEIDPTGEAFNPEFHQAMTMLPSEELEENSVVEVLQKGYKLHDRLIRPAMVVVSRKP